MKNLSYALIFIIFLLLLLGGALALRGSLSLIAYQYNVVSLSELCQPEFVLYNDVLLKGSGNQEQRIHFIEYFGRTRAVKSLMAATIEKRIVEPDMVGWIKVYHKLSFGPNSLPLLEQWLSDSTKWDVLDVYFFDQDYYASKNPFPQESVFEKRFPWEYRLFSVIWGKASAEERVVTLNYWISAMEKSENGGAEVYLFAALGRKGNDEIVNSRRYEIEKIKEMLPPSSHEAKSFEKLYGN